MKNHGVGSSRILVIFILMILALASGCAVNPATGERDYVLMSESEELALGRKHSVEVMKQYRAYDDVKLQQYVQSVGERVAKVSHRNNLYYRFTLLDSTQVNAFALPGGYIYITRGLLVYLNSEAELAAVLGHELGHVTARHSVRQHSMSTTTNLLGAIVAAASGVRGVGQLTNLLGTGIVRGYGREHELEADGLGVEYLAKAGYDPRAMEKVITTLKNQELFDKKLAREQGREPRAYHGVFSTHPANDTRLQQVLRRTSARFQLNPVGKEQDVAFLKRLSGLTFGDSKKDGITKGNTFYHPDINFKFSFPTGWMLSNQPSAIQITAPKNEAFIHVSMQDLNKRVTPKQFIEMGMGIKNTLSEKVIKVAGYSGYSVVTKGKTPYGQKNIRVAVLVQGKRAFIILGAAKQDRYFGQYDRQVLSSINSFSALNKADRKKAVELTVRNRRVDSRTRFSSLAKQSPITHHAEDQLRLLNGLFPAGNLKSGDLIKIIR
ncbi:MAG: peptidase M48 [Piscirickettsiaceae bacterium]|nr:MAG: peptidase M48 [Piscirickettsiaceae bacterium]